MRPDPCRTTGLHDPRPDGTCRDCDALVRAGDPVCDPRHPAEVLNTRPNRIGFTRPRR